jgi:hypothetical protein
VEPADYFAQAERAKLVESAGNGGDAAEPLSIGRFDFRAVGGCRNGKERLDTLVDVDAHLAMPAERFLCFVQCLRIAVRDVDAPKDVHLTDFASDRIV